MYRIGINIHEKRTVHQVGCLQEYKLHLVYIYLFFFFNIHGSVDRSMNQ